MSAPGIQAVIFDFDGVLVHSIELHALAYRAVLAPFNVPVSMHDVMVREGARSESILRELAEREGLKLAPAEVKKLSLLKQQVFQRIGQPEPYPEAQGVVAAVAGRGFPMAIVTGTRKENVPGIAPELVPFFDHLVTQESYQQDKPHPEPYATAADLLDLDPVQCLVIENAPRGVKSAKAAGMHVIAVTSTLPAEELGEADVIVERLQGILGHVPQRPGQPFQGR